MENSTVSQYKKDKLDIIKIDNEFAEAEISLFGAHILKFKPRKQENVIFVSKDALFSGEKAIRGGIPICFPWFGAGTTGDKSPSHGFARTSIWKLHESTTLPTGETKLHLTLASNDATREIWPFNFLLDYTVIVGKNLNIELACTNLSKNKFEITQALHSYFVVGDISKTTIAGFENCEYIDSIDEDKIKSEENPIVVDKEIDRIYINTKNSYSIKDNSLNRELSISKSGSHSTVLWNPWIEKSKKLSDFGDNEYKKMVCIETTNAGNDIVIINPNATHTLKTTISLK